VHQNNPISMKHRLHGNKNAKCFLKV
jgi:hypothetical protein